MHKAKKFRPRLALASPPTSTLTTMFNWIDLYFGDVSTSLRVGSYFLIFLTSLFYILWGWVTMIRVKNRRNKQISIVMGCLALIAFVVTWSLILDFFEQEADSQRVLSKEEYENAPSTFVKAYEEVTTKTGYFWSQQLLMFVVPACLFLQTETRRYEQTLPRGMALAYTATGFLGAISLSFPLFFSHVLLLHEDEQRPPGNKKRRTNVTSSTAIVRVSLLQIVCSVIASISVVVLPATVHTDKQSYVIALIALHVVLGIPSLVEFVFSSSTVNLWFPRTLSLKNVYQIMALASCFVHFKHMASGLHGVDYDVIELFNAGWQNTCQRSISYDVVFTTLVCALYSYAKVGTAKSFFLPLLLSPVLSVGTTFAYFLAMEEDEARVDDVKKGSGGRTSRVRKTPQRFDSSGKANVRYMRHSPGFEGYFDAEEDSKKRTKKKGRRSGGGGSRGSSRSRPK